MRTANDDDLLAAALDELSALAGADDRAVLAGIRGRLGERRLRVLVAGEAKRGKSTLVNALLGRAVLPVGVTPLTALATTIRYGADEGLTAVFRDGRTEAFPLSALDDLVTERGNPGNCRGLASVTVAIDAPVLRRGVELVDTPGTGSVYAHNTVEAEMALETMDAAVFVLTADPPVSASERDLMSRVAGLSVSMFVVLNKADYLDADTEVPGHPAEHLLDGHATSELAEAVEFTAAVAAEAASRPVRVYPMSARAELAGRGDPGFAAFAEGFAAYLESGRASDLAISVAGHVRRLAGSLMDEANLTRRAAQLRGGEAEGRVQEFSARLEAVAGRRRDAADLAAAEAARMLADLNESAAQMMREAASRVAADLDAVLDADLHSAPAVQIERYGRARLGDLAVAAAEAWRQERAQRLEDGLARVDDRLTGDLRAELDAVRDAAAQLLGLALTVPGPVGRLTPDLRFFYKVAEEAGQTELLAGAIRRHLPGEAGRRRAREYLRRETASLIPQQVGRARADLQYRLAEATRRLIREIEARYTESTGRLENALRIAATQRQATSAEAVQQDQQIAQRQEAIAAVLALLDQAAAANLAVCAGSEDTVAGGHSPALPGLGSAVTDASSARYCTDGG